MWISEDVKSNTFLGAAGGTYTKEGNKYLPRVDLASWDHYTEEKIEATIDVEGDKIVLKGADLTKNTQWVDIFQRAESNPK